MIEPLFLLDGEEGPIAAVVRRNRDTTATSIGPTRARTLNDTDDDGSSPLLSSPWVGCSHLRECTSNVVSTAVFCTAHTSPRRRAKVQDATPLHIDRHARNHRRRGGCESDRS